MSLVITVYNIFLLSTLPAQKFQMNSILKKKQRSPSCDKFSMRFLEQKMFRIPKKFHLNRTLWYHLYCTSTYSTTHKNCSSSSILLFVQWKNETHILFFQLRYSIRNNDITFYFILEFNFIIPCVVNESNCYRLSWSGELCAP